MKIELIFQKIILIYNLLLLPRLELFYRKILSIFCIEFQLYNQIMFFRNICFILLVGMMASQPNYQERVIYYGEKNAVCCNSFDQSDTIRLIINLNDRGTLRRLVRGGTSCSTWTLRCADKISPSPSMNLYNDDERVNFHQDTIRKYILGVLHQVIQNVTVVNPATFSGTPYNCVILGDGTQQHFGIDGDHDPAEIYLRCLSSKANQSSMDGSGQPNLQAEMEENESQ